jgi:hypothetical protein
MRRRDAAVKATDVERDAQNVIEFFIALAWQDAALVADFLKSAGIAPGTSFPKNALIKLALFCRLRLWEDIGLTSSGAGELPTAHTVFADILAELSGDPPRFETMTLSRQVHTFAEGHFTWPQSGAATFRLEDRTDSSDMLDCVAELLYSFRHLAESRGSSSPAGPMGNPGDESVETTGGA